MAIGLGTSQKDALVTLFDNKGRWSFGCGWKIGTPSNTEKIFRSLVFRGHAAETGQTPDGYATFEITSIGTNKAKQLKAKAARA